MTYRRAEEREVDGLAPPLDVLLVCSGLGPGGRPRVVANLASGWSEQGRRVGVATFDGTDDCYPLPPSVLRVQLPVPRLRPTMLLARHQARRLVSRLPPPARPLLEGRAAAAALTSHLRRTVLVRTLRQAIKGMEPAVVVAFGPAANVASLLASEGLGCRVVVSECNDVERQVLDFPVATLRKCLYPTAAAVTVNSRGMLAPLAAWMPPEKVRFAQNPLVIPSGQLVGPPPPGFAGPCVLIVARLVAQKNHDVLLDAFARLPPQLGHWRLAVVGAGNRRDALGRRAAALGLADRVDWHSHTHDPYAFYRHADIFALPSRFEGMPNALLEAMSFGVAPIVSDASPGPLELVRDGETGLVVPSDDPDALAAAITRLARDPALRQVLGNAAREEVERFAPHTALAAWEDAIGPAEQAAVPGSGLPMTESRLRALSTPGTD